MFDWLFKFSKKFKKMTVNFPASKLFKFEYRFKMMTKNTEPSIFKNSVTSEHNENSSNHHSKVILF